LSYCPSESRGLRVTRCPAEWCLWCRRYFRRALPAHAPNLEGSEHTWPWAASLRSQRSTLRLTKVCREPYVHPATFRVLAISSPPLAFSHSSPISLSSNCPHLCARLT